jgi:pimeloyl-ACP methyl ester carboxylesterase
VTVLDGQTLPGLLPRGWSPLASFWLEFSSEPVLGGALTLAGPDRRVVVLAKLDETSGAWILNGVAVVNGGVASVEVAGGGAFALVLRDLEAGAGDLNLGEALLGSLQAGSVDLIAGGSLDPAKSRASVVAELVTAQGRATVTNRSGALASGVVLFGDISERYQLRNGGRRFPPVYDEFLIGYRGIGGAENSVEAAFPLRPLLLFGAEELLEATVRLDISAPTNFAGGVLGASGGTLASSSVKVRAAAGDLASAQAVLLRELVATNFAELGKNGAVVVAGAELTIGSVAEGRRLALDFGAQAPGSFLVLGKALWRGGVYGVEPRERLRSDANGILQSAEPASGARLAGVTGSGQFLLLRVPGPLALVTGTATGGAGATVGVDGESWLSATDAAGRFALAAPAGSFTVRGRNPVTGREGSMAISVSANLAAVNADLTLGAPELRVVSVSPAAGSTNVSRIAPIVVNFSEAINPGTLVGNLRVLGTNGTPVLGSVSLNVRNTSATFLPQAQLAANTAHTIDVGGTVSAPDGRPLTGARAFVFETETDQLNRQPPQLITYEPVNGVAGLAGTPGTADAESPVILVNETSGQTATILSKVDGSFTNSIAAEVDDILSAVLVNRNGTRTTLPASRQIFRDGNVGLFSGGGILEAQSDGGPVQVFVEPGSIENKTKFRVTPIPMGTLLGLLKNPPAGDVKVLGGMVLEQEGELKVGADVSFPINASALNLTNAPEKASWALATPREIDGATVYEIVDRMVFENGKLVTHSPPFTGALLKELKRRFAEAKKFDDLNRKISKVLGLPDLRTTAYSVTLLPLLMSQGTSLVVQGKTASYLPDADGKAIASTERLLPGATITFAVDAFSGREGRLDPGATFTTSGSDGRFAFLFPVNRLQENGFAVRATHPAFAMHRALMSVTIPSLAQQFNAIAGDLSANGPSLLGVMGAISTAANTITPKVNANLEFFRVDASSPVSANADAGPPTILFTITPRDPGPGTNTVDGAVITIAAADDLSVGSISLDLVEQQTLSEAITNNTVTISQIGATTNIGSRFAQAQFRVKSDYRANVRLQATAADGAGNLVTAEALIAFAGDRIFPAPNTNDLVSPRILTTFPRNNATGVRPGQAVALEFSEPMARTNMTNITAWLTVGGGALFSSAELSRDGKQLTVAYAPGLSGTVTMTVNSGVTDVNGNAFDQDPVAPGGQSFTLQFTLSSDAQDFPGMANGGGAAMQGAYAYLLERGGPNDGSLVVYDISSNTPAKKGEINLPGYPRDLAVISNYSFVMATNGPVRTNTLVAVVGGKAGAETFQYLWIVDVTDPANPTRLSGANISLAISTVTKVKWAAPFLAYLEAGADITSVSLVDLQTFLIGMSAGRDTIATFPMEGQAGVDANGDGDYTDAGDTLPLPERNPTEYFGKFTSFVDAETTRRIEDFELNGDAGLLGIVMGRGVELGSNGLPDSSKPVLPAYRTVISGLGTLNPELATLLFTNGLPKRMALFHQVLLAGDTNNFRNLSVVSFSDTNKLAVIDITDPLNPKELTRIDLPAQQIPQTLNRRADGLLAVASMENVYLFDPTKFLSPAVAGNPASLIGVIPGAGSGARSYVADETGINIVNLGGRHSVNHTAPDIRFMSFPSVVVDPLALAGKPIAELDATFRLARLESALEKTKLFAQPIPTNPPVLLSINSNTLYYVRIDGVGSLGKTGRLDLVVESLNGAGRALPNGGPTALPVRFAPTNTLKSLDDTNFLSTNAVKYPRELRAVRMSEEKGSPYYNVFLAGPFVLTDTPLTLNQLTQVKTQLPRSILRAGRFLWAGLDSAASPLPYTTNILSPVVAKRLQQGDAATINVAHIAQPVIFIPGIAGSILESTSLSLASYWAGLGLDVQHLRLTLDPANSPSPIAASDAIRYVVPALDLISIYGEMFKYLTSDLGYVEYDFRDGLSHTWHTHRTTTNALAAQIPNNPNLFVYPYDWRKSNADAAAELREYVRLIRMFNPEVEQVNILAHSMGGLVARRFVLENPGVVDKMITIGTPWLGAPKAITALETGDFDDFKMNLLVSKERLRELAEYFPGVQELLPSKAYWDIGGAPLVEGSWDLNENGTAFETYSYDDYKAAIDGKLHPIAAVSPVATNEVFHGHTATLGEQDDWSKDSSGVNYFHIYGVQAVPDTIGQVKANLRLRPVNLPCNDLSIFLPSKPKDKSTATGLVPIEDHGQFVIDRRFEYVRTLGDGTVPVASAARLLNGNDFNAPGSLLFPIISPSGDQDIKSEHNGMLGNTNVQFLVRDILTGVIEPSTNAPGVPPEIFRVSIVNYEPGTILITDAGGENDDATDVWFGQQFVRDMVARIIDWVAADDANRYTAEYEIANTKKGNASHTISFASATGQPYSVDVERVANGVAEERFRWIDIATEQSPGELKIDWTKKTAELKAGSPLATVATTLHLVGDAARDENPPRLTTKVTSSSDPAGDFDDVVTVDVEVVDDVNLPADLVIYIGYDSDRDGNVYNDIFTPVPKALMTAGTGNNGLYPINPASLEGTTAMVVSSDKRGNVSLVKTVTGNATPKTNPDCTPPSAGQPAPLQAEKNALVAALKEALTAANASPWMLDANPANTLLPGVQYMLEQGSGACFWMGQNSLCSDCDGIFKAGLSDHDYEVFLPVFSNWSSGPPNGFAGAPYAKANVEGDWYFLPPVTNGVNLVYARPDGGSEVVALVPGAIVRTPANYLIDAMTQAASNSLHHAGFATAAHKLTLFSARAEHFEAGFIDLERPLELGSDATGDVGTGRQSLLLKWVLEGEYVEGVPGMRDPPPPLEDVLTAMKSNGINAVEGYEWGVYQEFSALGTGMLVRTAKMSGGAKVDSTAQDYFYDVKKKQIKYAGKSGIRAAFGLMVAEAQAADYFMTRAEFRAKPYRSFEQFVAGQGAKPSVIGIFGTYGPMLTNFYKAKIADDDFIKPLLEDDNKCNEFLAAAINFCRYVQGKTVAKYNTGLAAMSAAERASRVANLKKVREGFPNLGKPGLDELKATPSLPFSVGVRNRGPTAAPGAEIRMTVGGTNKTVIQSFGHDAFEQIPPDSDAPPVFVIKDAESQHLPKLVYVTLKGGSGFTEANVSNNWLGFYYYMLNLTSSAVPAGADAEIVEPTHLLPTGDPTCFLKTEF